jgi:hypothetical protein
MELYANITLHLKLQLARYIAQLTLRVFLGMHALQRYIHKQSTCIDIFINNHADNNSIPWQRFFSQILDEAHPIIESVEKPANVYNVSWNDPPFSFFFP